MNNRRGTTVVSNQNRRLPKRPVIHVLPDEMALRVVCHASVIGGIIGPNGGVVSKLRRETGTKIHCESPVNGSDHWIVFIVGSTAVNKTVLLTDRVGEVFSGEKHQNHWVTCDVSAAQTALIRVLERSWAVLAAKDSGGIVDKEAYCGILADRNQIGSVLGLGGKNVEWMRRNSGAAIRILPPPICGSKTDELIQITGDVLAVKKALVMVSSSLQDCPPVNGYPPPLCIKGYEQLPSSSADDPHSEFFPNLRSLLPNRQLPYEEGNSGFQVSKDKERKVVFKLLCSSFAAGGIIGKQGGIIRALQNETGASISIGTPLKVSGERVVTISARESLEARYSHAQKALVRVFERSVEIDVEKGLLSGLHDGSLVKAKLLVASHFANDLVRNRDTISAADLYISVDEQNLECFSENEMVIEIKGEYGDVHKALSHVSSSLRDSLLPQEVFEEIRGGISNQYESSGTTYNSKPSQHNATRGGDSVSVSDGEKDSKMVRTGIELMKLIDNDVSSLLQPRSKGVSIRKVTLELALEKDALASLYGRDGAGLDHLQQISGAKVEVKDANGIETTVLVYGTPEETRAAMSLLESILDDDQ